MRISNFIYPPTIARCQHIKVNGVQCGSPALKNRRLCHFHQRWQQRRIQLNANRARRSRYSLDMPILEDANSIQVALMQGLRLLLTNQVDHKTAALLFYALQTASTNLSRTTFEPRPQQVVIDPRGIPDTSLGDEAWFKEEFAEDEQEEGEADDESDTVDIQAMADCGAPSPRTGPVCKNPNPQPHWFQAPADITSPTVPHPNVASFATSAWEATRSPWALPFTPPYNTRFLTRSNGLGCSGSSPTPDAQEI